MAIGRIGALYRKRCTISGSTHSMFGRYVAFLQPNVYHYAS